MNYGFLVILICVAMMLVHLHTFEVRLISNRLTNFDEMIAVILIHLRSALLNSTNSERYGIVGRLLETISPHHHRSDPFGAISLENGAYRTKANKINS